MLRSRILSAATAAVLLLGMSVGGAGAAFADTEEAPPMVDETTVVESPSEPPAEPIVEEITEPAEEPVAEPLVEPVAEPEKAVTTRTSSGATVVPTTTPAGITVTVNGPNPFTCNSAPRNYEKPDDWDSSDNAGATEVWGTAVWSENGTFSWTINPGYDVNLCIKGGQTIVEIDTSVFAGSSYAFKDLQGSGISHAGFIVVSVPTPVTPAASVEQIDCFEEELVGGTITVDLTKQGVTYTIEDAEGDPVAFDATTGTTGMLAPGTYTVFGVDGDATDDFAVSAFEQDFTIDPFTEDCGGELGSVVVPIVTYVDRCEGEGPNALRFATFTVTDVENASYTYTVNGGAPIAVDFGGEETVTIPVNPLDMVVVTATPAEGFELNDGYEPWSHSFIGAAFCPGTFPATVAAADITPADCEGSDVVVTLTNEPGVVWTLNGQVVDGNAVHELAPGSAVTLTAGLEGPEGAYTWSEPDQQTLWTADGTSDEDCLSSLAYTGTNVGTEWIGVAAVLMMIVGMGFVIRRRSVEI